MEEPDSSGSDVDKQPEIREMQHTTNKSESDVSYSDSESDENKEPESLLNVNKPQHVPGKYKQSIKPKTEQETKAEFVANQNSPDINAGDASESKTSNKEETQASSLLSAEKDIDFSQTGIFEKSMLVIPSIPVDDSDEQKVDENVVSKVRPPVPPKPSLDLSISKQNDLAQVRDTSFKFRPNPAPRKSKLLSEASLEDKILLTDEEKRPRPSPRTKKKRDKENLLFSPEIVENVLPGGGFTKIENDAFLEIPDKQGTFEEPKIDFNTTAEENSDSVLTVDIGSANTEIREENYCEYNSYKLETDATLITDSFVKDVTVKDAFSESFENVEAESRTVSHKVEEVSEADSSIYVDKDNSDSEVATFENDFPDTDSSNSINNDLNNDLNKSESESDDQFKTPDNQSEDEAYGHYDSQDGLAIDTNDVKTEDVQSSQPKESQENGKNIPYGDKHEEQASEVETDFEESVVVLREKKTGYESLSSTFSASELTDVTLSNDKSLAETEKRPPSVRDRISCFESFKHKSNENLGDRNVSICDKSSSFEVLSGNERNSNIEADLCKRENVTKAKDKIEKHEVVTDTGSSTEVVPNSDDVDESVVIVSADEIQIEWASSTKEKMDVNEELNDESNDVKSSDKLPPVPPKSEVVLESMRTSYLENPPNIPPRSLRPELDSSLKEPADTSSQSGTLNRNTEHVLKHTQETTSSLPAVAGLTPESHQDGARQQHTQPEESYYQNTQQPQPPAWNPFYYIDERGNVQYVNPYAFYNPSMNPGMFNPSPNMQYYQQPQFYPSQYSTLQGQNPNIGADDSSHEYDEVSQPVKGEQSSSAVNAEQRHSLGTEERAHDDHRKSRNIETHRAKPDKEHQQSARGVHRNITNEQQRDYNQQGELIAEDAKLKKSKSDDPTKQRVTKSKPSSSPVRRSMSSSSHSAKPGKRKDEAIRRLNEDDEVYEEVGNITNYYIYFKGISPNTKKENLSNFIEATTKGESESDKVIFNHSRTCALVPVSKNTKPELKKVRDRIRTRGIDGAKPEVYEVEPPKCIAVSSDEDIKSLESLGLYFESRKVAASEVEGDPYESEDGSCFVLQFSDPNVVKRVCGRQTPYVWEGRKLRVSPYFVCEAGAIWDSELHVVKIPGPVVMSLEPSYLLLLQRECCEELITKLESGHCLPTFTEVGLKLECTLTPKTPSFRSLVKDWENASRCIVDTYIAENVIERKLKSSAEVWKGLLTFFESEKYEGKTNLVASFDDPSFVILLVGFKDIVDEVHKELIKKQNDIEKQLRRRTETIRFEPLKLKLLEKVGLFEEVKKNADDVEIHIRDGEITVDGQPEDISNVQICLFETDNKISESSWAHGLSRDFVDFIKRKLVEKITSVLTTTGIVAEWKINDNDFILYAYERDAACHLQANVYDMLGEDDDIYSNVDDASTNAKDLIQSVLFERQEIVQDSLVEALTSPEWISFIESMTEDYEDVAEVEFKETTGTITIYGIQKEARNLYAKVKEFKDENSVKVETMKCGTINLRFIKMHRPDFTASLEKKFEHHKVRIEVKEETVIIRGTKAGIAKTKEEFVKVFNSVISEKHTIQKVAVKDVFRDVRESGTIDVVEKDTGCLIKLPGENETFKLPAKSSSDDSDDGGQVQGAAAPRQVTSRSAATTTANRRDKRFKAANGVIVSLVKGELGQQDGDVIVVTTAPNLNMNSGNACKSVLRAGGQRLQDECKEKYKKDIKFGEIAVIHGGGSLECNMVYLTTLPNWNSEHNPRQVLDKVMKDSLDLASNHQKHSILFCAMGTGQLKYPTDLVAMLMYQAVIDFDKNNPTSTLKDVRFVLYQKDYSTIKAFEAEEKIRLEGEGERPTFDLKDGNLSIELSVENIAEQKVDGILCSTCPKMELSRNGACQALLRAGGQSLQDECKSKYNNKLEEGQVVEIGGGKMSCKSVFLTVLPGYGPHAIGVLTKVIQTLLQLAQAKRLSSLALPALGTGNLKYPKDEVCKCMFETVREWAQKNPNSTIKTVRFIMHAKDHGVIQMFKSYIVNAKGRGKRESRHFSQEQTHPSVKRANVEQNKAMYNAHSEGVQVGKIKLRVFKGDILSQSTDVVVSSVGKDFEFLGAVANELKTKYPKMEEKCHRKDKMQMLKKDGVVQTKGYGLPAKKVLHVQFAEHLSDWQKRIYKCLEIVNKNSFRTVAFPVLGTGKGFTSFNPEAIAGCMFDAINEFVQAYRSHSIAEVRLIVYKGQPIMFDPIMDKLHKKVQEASSPSGEGTAKRCISKTVKKLKEFITGKEDGVMSEEDKKKLLDMTSSLDVIIYSNSKSNIDNCKKELDAKLEKIYTKRKIEDWKDLIKSLTKEESEMLDIVALANIKIDHQAGIITIEGPMKQVSDVYDEMYSNLLKIERRRHEVAAADELFKIVQWQYVEVTQTENKLTPYNKALNQQIERAYKNNKSKFEFVDDSGDLFVIDFSQLVEYPKNDDQDKIQILRKDILKAAASALPDEWAQMRDDENIKVVSLVPTDQTYKDIEQRFITEVKTGSYAGRLNFDPNNMKVNKIERIQNKTLYQQYQAKKKQMTEQKPNLPTNMPIERELWHGTKNDAVTSITMHGFNRSYSGNANGQPWYGDGVYFAANASYSARGWLSGAGAGSKGYMFLVKTLTGQFVKGQKGMRYLPAVDPKDPTLLYDCAVDNPAGPMEFVIFNDTQAYPAYIITFTT